MKAPNNYNQLVAERKLLPLEQYDYIIVGYSGGKDCTAAVVHLLDMGVKPEKIELWHQHVDGVGGESFMDWPCTENYVKAAGEALGIKVKFQWKDGGFLGEMLRNNEKTKGMWYEDEHGEAHYCAPGATSKNSTRLKFPQVSADLSVRYCSAYLKIDICKRAINNDPRFDNANVLLITGERREESAARSKYDEVVVHPSTSKNRRVDQWRSVIDWEEEQVWDAMRRMNIQPHPAYRLGFSRVSCMACIFGGKDQWATVRYLDNLRFDRIAGYEKQFGVTIKKELSVIGQADSGCVFEAARNPEITSLAMNNNYPLDGFLLKQGDTWTYPAGAFKKQGGPT